MQKQKVGRPRTRPDMDRVTDLIRRIPVRVLVNMVTKSGLPTHEARELCQEFKRIKA